MLIDSASPAHLTEVGRLLDAQAQMQASPLFVEEPILSDDVHGHRKLRDACLVFLNLDMAAQVATSQTNEAKRGEEEDRREHLRDLEVVLGVHHLKPEALVGPDHLGGDQQQQRRGG